MDKMSNSLAVRDIAKAFGSIRKMYRAVSRMVTPGAVLSERAVYKWVERNKVPSRWIYPLCLAAKNAGIEGVTPNSLTSYAAKELMDDEEDDPRAL